MCRLFAISVLLVAAPLFGADPKPPDSIDVLIDQLGSDSYHCRENAEGLLQVMAENNLTKIKAGLANDDLEIRCRCENILKNYYTVVSDDIHQPYPSIWLLPTDIRFPKDQKDKDISKEYFSLSRKEYNAIISYPYQFGEDSWRYDHIETNAIATYIYDRMIAGMKRSEAKNLLHQMVYNSKHFYFAKTGSSSVLPPKPVESKEEIPIEKRRVDTNNSDLHAPVVLLCKLDESFWDIRDQYDAAINPGSPPASHDSEYGP